MFLDGLDELDRKIVRLLIANARISYSELGEQVGISRVAAKMRVQALEKKGVIEEYTTVINPQKISGAVSFYFEIETTPETLAARLLPFEHKIYPRCVRAVALGEVRLEDGCARMTDEVAERLAVLS